MNETAGARPSFMPVQSDYTFLSARNSAGELGDASHDRVFVFAVRSRVPERCGIFLRCRQSLDGGDRSLAADDHRQCTVASHLIRYARAVAAIVVG
jgi:hypothetical protein